MTPRWHYFLALAIAVTFTVAVAWVTMWMTWSTWATLAWLVVTVGGFAVFFYRYRWMLKR